MSGPDLNNDDILLALLAEMIDSDDQPPAPAVQAALAAWELARADGELAVLVAEAAGEETLVGLREETGAIEFKFRASNMSVELEIGPGGHAIGVISPAQSMTIELESSSGQAPVRNPVCRSDEFGRFQLDLAFGLCRLRVGTGEGAVLTPWFYC
jgi:hypothetical protein